METVKALKAGVLGALSLNLVHESARKLVPNAPHVDQIAMRGLSRYALQPLGLRLSNRQLRGLAFVGDVISNSLYYAAVVGASRHLDRKSVWQRAWLYGVGAGVGAVVLPPYMRLGQQPSRNFPVTAALTVAWYSIGALVAATIFSRDLEKANQEHKAFDQYPMHAQYGDTGPTYH